MKRLSLRTQLVVSLLLFGLLTAGAGLSYIIHRGADRDLHTAFQEDLFVLTELPRLRGRLRKLDLVTDKYLLTGNAAWLAERGEALRDVRRDLSELRGLLTDPHERLVLDHLERLLSPYVERQQAFIARRRAGKLTAAEANAFAASKRSIDEIIDVVMTMKDLSVEELRETRLRADRASRLTAWLILGIGAVAAAAVAGFIWLYLVAPLERLERRAATWRLGEPWPPAPGPAGPEVERLDARLGEMAGRLNEQYRRDRDLLNLRTQLVSVVSHEFNNALNVLGSATFLLEESEKEPGGQRARYYEMLNANIRALTVTVNNLLNLGRLDSGRFAVSPRRMQVRDLARETLDRLEPLAARKHIEVRLEMPDEAIAVNADPEALSLAMTNLVGNAIKYTPEGGRVTVRVEAADGRQRVTVEDTGIGVAAAEHEKILRGHYRTEAGKAAAKGFGIGLALSRQIIEAHGARLHLESEPGKGSRFWFDLPVWTA